MGWNDYRARWYDASIGRFTSVDPIAEQFPHVTTYNYAENKPINSIDLWGLQAVLSIDGSRLMGYKVQADQGPTQIAKDLNENHSDKIKGKVIYTDIVYSNLSKFDNVVKGKGEVFDIDNPDYYSGNIEPGDYLNISDGGFGAEIDQVEKEIAQTEKSIDSIVDLKAWEEKALEISENINEGTPDFPDEPKGGLGIGTAIKNTIRERKIRKMEGEIRNLENKSDSLKNVNEELKGGRN